MKTHVRQDKALLLKTARAVFEELEGRTGGTSLRLRWPSRVGKVNTGGWRAVIGNLGSHKPKLEIWLDRFAGYDARKFNFCFHSYNRSQLRRIVARVAKQLRVHRVITHKDVERDGYSFLFERLRRDEFSVPILEEYYGKYCYYGIYDPSVGTNSSSPNPHLVARAAAFFESVARTLPRATPEREEHEAFAQEGNRKAVISHLQRERSRVLATDRKIRDNYRCQVCGLRFENLYGEIGAGFAEAHHRVPLNQLKGSVKTRIEDLSTVCANCHRILHRMEGRRNDVEKLRVIVSRRKRGR